MILANVRSLKGLKMDELRANATFFNEYRDACLMAFTETWFEKNVGDRGTFIKGFGCPARLDRDKQTTGKEKGGVFVYMSTSVGAKPSLCVNSSTPRTLYCCQCIFPANFHNCLRFCLHTPQSQCGSRRPAYL